MLMRPALLCFGLLALSGCAGLNRGESWPTLAPRQGEVSPLVPRTPMGACAGCGQDVFASLPAPAALPPVPTDVAARLGSVEQAIAAIETAAPARRAAWARAEAAATGTAADSDAATEMEVQRSRYESLLLPLAIEERALDAIEDDLTGKADPEAGMASVAALRARIAILDTAR